MRGARRARRGFSLLEAVVVVGILAALVAILFPVCSRVRQSARDVVCGARLRDLTLACSLYLQQYETYPEPLQDRVSLPAVTAVYPTPNPIPGPTPAAAGLQPMPQNNQTRLFNQLATYLRFPRIVRAVPAMDLPPKVQCPSVEPVQTGRGPVATADPMNFSYFTGYVYLAGLDGTQAAAPGAPVVTGAAPVGTSGPALPSLPPLPLPVSLPPLLNLPPGSVLKPGQAANLRGSRRAVLWADDVRLALDPSLPQGGYWVFAHTKGGAPPGPMPLTAAYAVGCRGQHRAYSDHSVEWHKAEDLGLPLAAPGTQAPSLPVSTGSLLDPFASLKIGPTYWWY